MIKHLVLSLAFLLALAGLATAQDIRPMVGKLSGHVAEDGEDLFSIAFKNRLAMDHLAFANGFPITMVRVKPGTRVIVPTWRILPANPPRNGIVVNLPERGVYLFRNGKFDRFYPVSIGDEVMQKGRFWTRTGNYHIAEKQKNPTWVPPGWAKDRTPVGPGPNNPLGDRWIGLSLERTGIHGTNDPLNVGNSVTHGCMRTYPELVRELYELVQVGWDARIEYETTKVGRGPDGKLYIVTFGDVYKQGDTVTSALNLLRKLHLKPGRDNFRSVLAQTLGTPICISSTDTVYEEFCREVGWKPVYDVEE